MWQPTESFSYSWWMKFDFLQFIDVLLERSNSGVYYHPDVTWCPCLNLNHFVKWLDCNFAFDGQWSSNWFMYFQQCAFQESKIDSADARCALKLQFTQLFWNSIWFLWFYCNLEYSHSQRRHIAAKDLSCTIQQIPRFRSRKFTQGWALLFVLSVQEPNRLKNSAGHVCVNGSHRNSLNQRLKIEFPARMEKNPVKC